MISASGCPDVLSAALSYSRFGWSLIPITGDKKPAVKWKTFQTACADELQLHDWFDGRDDLGLAVVLGQVSGGLTCRDFDKAAAYDAWQAVNPDLAKTLPTVRTKRGFHIYFRSDLDRTQKFDDGELRSGGSYVVLPPSRHPSGHQYCWLHEPSSNIPVLDATVFLPSVPCSLARDTDRTESNLSDLCLSARSVLSVSAEVVVGTLPGGFGTRRHRLFELARRVRAHPQLASVPLAELKPMLKEWHRLALPNIRTKPFDETWADFVEAYGNVDPKRCGDAAVAAMQRADATALPPEAMQYESPIIRRLVALCRELARTSNDGVLYLSCRNAAKLLGMSEHKTAGRWLGMLVADDLLVEVTKGGPQTMRATRFRWRGS